MSLIDTLENIETEFGDVWISKDLCAQIIVALKAGQEMRDTMSVIDQAGHDACDNWDAAVRGSV